MKSKLLLIALAIFTAGALAGQAVPAVVTLAIDTCLDRAALNRNLARGLAPFSETGAAYFYGRASVYEELGGEPVSTP